MKRSTDEKKKITIVNSIIEPMFFIETFIKDPILSINSIQSYRPFIGDISENPDGKILKI